MSAQHERYRGEAIRTRTAWRIVGEVNRGVPASTCSTGGSVANRSTIAALVASTAIASLQRDCRARA